MSAARFAQILVRSATPVLILTKRKIMIKNKDYWLKEANRHLAIALIGIPEKNRRHVDKAIECLGNYQKIAASDSNK